MGNLSRACIAVSVAWSVAACAGDSSLSKRLLQAVLDGNHQEAESAIESGADPRVDPAGNCLLFAAVHAKRADILELLVKRGADINCRAKNGDTLISRALDLELPLLASRLASLGADVNAAPGLDQAGYRPLFVAVYEYTQRSPDFDLELVKTLLNRGANPNLKERLGVTPLGRALSSGRLELVELLLLHHADPNQPDGEGSSAMTPLEIAVGRDKDIVMKLLSAGADPKKEVVEGRLLSRAARLQPNVVPILKQHGAVSAPVR